MTPSPTPTVINGIPLAELLSSCIDACHRGCEVIRSVHRRSLLAVDVAHGDDDGDDDNSNTAITNAVQSASIADVTSPPSTRETSDGSMTIPPSRQPLIAHTFKLSTSHNTIDPVTNCVVIDPRSALTEADEASQAVILACLRGCWGEVVNVGVPTDGSDKIIRRPRLWIVGEEDDTEACLFNNDDGGGGDNGGAGGGGDDIDELFERYGVERPNEGGVVMNRNLVQPGLGIDTNQTSADNQELIVFIDPLDGTREYIENRIHNVQCLIGITLNGVPIAGAVGLPFGSGSNTSDNNNNNKRDEDLIEVAYGWIMPQNCREVDVDTINNSAYHMIASGIKHFDAKNKMPTDSTITTATSDNNGLLSNLNDNDEEDDTLIILSGDSQKPALQITMDCLENDVLRNSASSTAAASVDKEMDSTSATSFPYRKIICGGCGNKILYLGRRHQLIFKRKKLKRKLQQESGSETTSDEPISIVGTIAISPPGSSSWDTAAPSAVLLSLDPNALVTDLIGRPLVYNGVDLTNVHGVVVSSGDGAVKVHRELCDRLSRNEAFCSVIGVDNR